MYKSLLIGVPTTNQTMVASTALSIADTTRSLTARGIRVGLHNIDSAEVVTARDMFANMVLHSSEWEALLFVDSDMAFSAALVERMVSREQPLVAAAYPRRLLDFAAFATAVSAHGNVERALAEASIFTLKLAWSEEQPPQIRLDEGFCRAAAVGMGCTLISREVFLRMVDKKLVRPRLDLRSSRGECCYSFFENIELGGERLGEDYSFCHRWTAQLNEPLWICIDADISHVGHFEYRASFQQLLHAQS